MSSRTSEVALTRHRLQEGFLLRLAWRPEHDAFVLRGGMRLRQRFPRHRRPALDIDLVCPSPIGARELEGQLRAVFAEDRVSDGVRFDSDRFRIDPRGSLGFRVIAAGRVDGVDGDLIVDVRMDLPLWPPPSRETLVAERGAGSLWMCRPETQVGRKVQVTAALGPRACRPKDLLDLYWLLTEPPPEGWALGEAIEAAFEGHPGDVSSAREVLCAAAGRPWRRPHRDWGGVTLEQALSGVRAGLAPVLGGMT